MTKTGWIVTGVATVLALMAGFGIGWFSNQAYIRSQITSAFEDIEADFDETTMDEDMTAMDEYEEEPAEEAPDAVPMSESASDGIWDIRITKVERATQVSGSYSNAVAGDGQEFFILDVEMTNASDSPQMPEIDTSEVVDEDGSRYGYHSDASFALDEDDALYTDVNPGGTTSLRIPFEMQEGTVIVTALLSGTWSDTGRVAAIEVEE